MLKKLALPALCVAAVSGAVQAAEVDVAQAFDGFVGAEAVDQVRKLQYGELYEVLLKNGQLFYTDEQVSFLLDGRIIDTATRRDITQDRLNQLSAIDFSTLPLENAIKQVRGNGSRIIASFEDPRCGYCKRFGAELESFDDVTIYTFLYPVLGPESDSMSRNIWCSADPAKTWNDWILRSRTPKKASCDAQAVDQNIALGRELRISGTPTLFFADGRRVGGYMPAQQLEAVFAEVEASTVAEVDKTDE